MNRYVFYNFIIVSFINIMLYVPHILISFRFTGAVSSLIVGAAIGTALVYLYMSALARYPGMGFPEILKQHMPQWAVSALMLFYAAMWWFATSMVVVAYAILINRFFNPDANSAVILILLVLACGYAATRSSLTVMLVIEIGLIINAPIILFVMFKAVRSPQLNWDAIHIVANYVTQIGLYNTDWTSAERQLARTFSKTAESLLRKIQKAGVDPLGFGLRYRATHPGNGAWGKWQSVYPHVKFVVETDMKIEGTGLLK
ncbi:Ger(x)C family spore germination C-terminal domain-containing protein [Paenibacillus arenilitoris]|uniref:Ger(x)C family spore germination C-terminal domain-containing protein n=1 Tax=Paenibacillus arenilitoris TaxID=2772299 RepID=UPI00295B6CD4|nr:Ger(x)C family spore germination C-terminal domain-containing protein [Paenibacillus arenilitoris]